MWRSPPSLPISTLLHSLLVTLVLYCSCGNDSQHHKGSGFFGIHSALLASILLIVTSFPVTKGDPRSYLRNDVWLHSRQEESFHVGLFVLSYRAMQPPPAVWSGVTETCMLKQALLAGGMAGSVARLSGNSGPIWQHCWLVLSDGRLRWKGLAGVSEDRSVKCSLVHYQYFIVDWIY